MYLCVFCLIISSPTGRWSLVMALTKPSSSQVMGAAHFIIHFLNWDLPLTNQLRLGFPYVWNQPASLGLQGNPQSMGPCWHLDHEGMTVLVHLPGHAHECRHMLLGVQLVKGSPQKRWMVYSGKCHLEMDDYWGYPYDSGNLHIVDSCFFMFDDDDWLFLPLWREVRRVTCDGQINEIYTLSLHISCLIYIIRCAGHAPRKEK